MCRGSWFVVLLHHPSHSGSAGAMYEIWHCLVDRGAVPCRHRREGGIALVPTLPPPQGIVTPTICWRTRSGTTRGSRRCKASRRRTRQCCRCLNSGHGAALRDTLASPPLTSHSTAPFRLASSNTQLRQLGCFRHPIRHPTSSQSAWPLPAPPTPLSPVGPSSCSSASHPSRRVAALAGLVRVCVSTPHIWVSKLGQSIVFGRTPDLFQRSSWGFAATESDPERCRWRSVGNVL